MALFEANCGDPDPFPDGSVGVAYSHSFSFTGFALPPLVWSIVAGALPAGLSLNTGTGAVTGTPTGPAGLSSFTGRLTDAEPDFSDVNCSILITELGISCDNP